MLKEFQLIGKVFKLEILANVKRLEIPAFFLTLPRADIRWNEIPIIIRKLNEAHFHILSLSYQEHCTALNKNSVLVTRHFRWNVENFLKSFAIFLPLRKTKYYVIRVG